MLLISNIKCQASTPIPATTPIGSTTTAATTTAATTTAATTTAATTTATTTIATPPRTTQNGGKYQVDIYIPVFLYCLMALLAVKQQ